MDIRKYFSRKRAASEDNDSHEDEGLTDSHVESQSDDLVGSSQPMDTSSEVASPQPDDCTVAATPQAVKKKVYKSRLTYRRQWESKYPWVYCEDAQKGMFCKVCQKFGKPPANARGGWTSRGISDWNHATEMLKLHNDSKWHKDAAMMARMAKQQSVVELQCAGAARILSEKRAKNRAVLLKLLRSVYFLVKHRIPHTTTFQDLVALQVANGDQILEKHIAEGPGNAQYTSKFSIVSLIEAVSTWVDEKLIDSLKESPFFSILADESEDISSQEELSICCRWIVNGKPEEHFLTILHVLTCDAETITEALDSFIASKGLDYRKLVGQGYDGAAVFSGVKNGVQMRMRVHSAHALFIHCACHRLQLASVQAAASAPVIQKVFGVMGNLWKLFYYSPKKAQTLKEVQAVLSLPQLKIVKPSDTRWLSHERCMRAIRKELPAIIISLQQLHEATGDAEAFGLSALLSSFTGIVSVVFLSDVLDLLAKLNASMQKKVADFSRLGFFLDAIKDELKSLKDEKADWCSAAESALEKVEKEFDIAIGRHSTGSARSEFMTIRTIQDYREKVVIPYIDSLLCNINERFSDRAVKLLVASSIFNPAELPTESGLGSYGNQAIQDLADFYGTEVSVTYLGVTYTSSPLLDTKELLSEWKVFRRALCKEKELLMTSKKLTKAPSLQNLLQPMQASEAYRGIFPQIFKLINIILALPIGTATVERSFSDMKMIKTRLRNRLSDCNLDRLMKIAVEGPQLSNVDFEEILDIFKKKNRRIEL